MHGKGNGPTGERYEMEVEIPLQYKGLTFERAYRGDFIVEDVLMVELKCALRLIPLYTAQTLSYMKLLELREGLLFNFWVPRLKDGGIRRLVYTHEKV